MVCLVGGLSFFLGAFSGVRVYFEVVDGILILEIFKHSRLFLDHFQPLKQTYLYIAVVCARVRLVCLKWRIKDTNRKSKDGGREHQKLRKKARAQKMYDNSRNEIRKLTLSNNFDIGKEIAGEWVHLW